MASIRRTLSPLARPGSSSNGEACQGPSPLSKSSAHAQNHPSSSGLLSSILGLPDPRTLVVGFFSPRASRQGERSRPKGQTWRRSLFHCLVFFVIGLLVGLTPFFSMSPWMSIVSKRQDFSFEVSAVANLPRREGSTGNATRIAENGGFNNATLEPRVKEQGSIDGTMDNISTGSVISKDMDLVINQSFPQDVVLGSSSKLLIIVTPTYTRPFQAYYLSRLAYTLKLVQPPLLWIVVEMTAQSEQTADILRRTGVVYRHLVCKKNLTDIIDKRVHQRNVALSHIETHKLDGIVHFADDENMYSVDLFERMRQIRRVGTWTVAKFIKSKSKLLLEGPVCNGTQVVGWNVSDLRRNRLRRFHADMAGFAFNSTIIWDPKRWHRPIPNPIRQLDTEKDGFKAGRFIEQLVEDESQMEGLPDDCSHVMVWQLSLESSESFYPPRWLVAINLDMISQLA